MELGPLTTNLKELSPLLTVLGAIAGATLGATLVHLYTQHREGMQKKEREKKIAYQILVRVGWTVALSDVLPTYLKQFVSDAVIKEMENICSKEFDISHLLSATFEEGIKQILESGSNDIEMAYTVRAMTVFIERVKANKIILPDILSITHFPKSIILINEKFNDQLEDAAETMEALKVAIESKSLKIFGAREFQSTYRLWQDTQNTAKEYLEAILKSQLVRKTEHDYVLSHYKADISGKILRSFLDQGSLSKAKEALPKENITQPDPTEPADPLAQP